MTPSARMGVGLGVAHVAAPATTMAASPTTAPGAPWRRLHLRALGRRTAKRRRNAWSVSRALIRLLGATADVATGVARLAWSGAVHRHSDTRNAQAREGTQQLVHSLLRRLRVHVHVAGPRPVGPVLYACNHLSWLDVLVIMVALPDSVLISKREVSRWPVIGGVVRRSQTVLVDRTPTRALVQAVARVRWLLDHGRSVVLFAEGTTTDGSVVLPFKSSFFDAAVRAGVQVVPVSLRASTGPAGPDPAHHVCWWGDDTLLAHLPRVAGTRRISYTVRLGEPVSAAPLVAGPAEASPALSHTSSADRARRRARSVWRHWLARCAQRAVQRQVGHVDTRGVLAPPPTLPLTRDP